MSRPNIIEYCIFIRDSFSDKQTNYYKKTHPIIYLNQQTEKPHPYHLSQQTNQKTSPPPFISTNQPKATPTIYLNQPTKKPPLPFIQRFQ